MFDIIHLVDIKFLGAIESLKGLKSLSGHSRCPCHKLQEGSTQAHVKGLEDLEEPNDDLVSFVIVYEVSVFP